MAGELVQNGTRTPHVSQVNGYSLTEYAADPSTPAVKRTASPHSLIPEELCLPDGYPDVRAIKSGSVTCLTKDFSTYDSFSRPASMKQLMRPH